MNWYLTTALSFPSSWPNLSTQYIDGSGCVLLMIVTFPTVLVNPSLNLNFGIEFIDLLSEVAPKLRPLGLQGGRQQAVLDRKQLSM